MAYDGLVNYSIVNELKGKIINGKIDKIYEPNFEEILLGIYCGGIKYAFNLVINSQYYRANLTTNAKPNPNQAPNFCMTLRKHLIGTHITNIYTNNLERIIFIEFEGYNKSKDFSVKKLAIELMGKYSNIILLDHEDIIIDSLKHFSVDSGSYRNIFSGVKYKLPKSYKLDFIEVIDKSEFYRILKNNSEKFENNSLAQIISNTFTGISKASILSFETFLNITDEFNENSSNLLFNYISNIINNTDRTICCKYQNDYTLQLLDSDNSKIESTNKVNDLQINFFLDDFYTNKENNSIFINYRDNLLRLILGKLNKLNNKLDLINLKLNECKNAEQYKLYGELITSNLYKISNYNIDSITLDNYYDNNKPITIKLDNSISPSLNAKKFFKKYKKLKNAKEIVDEQKSSIVDDINYLESIVYEINSCKTILDIDEIYNEIQESNIKGSNQKKNSRKNNMARANSRKQNKVGEPLKFEIDGFTVLVGKNNKQNDYITTKIANKEDIWFHVKDFHGSHVILRTDNKNPSQDTINKCAKLAKEYSKVNDSSNISVDYTYVKYVKKPSGSKPGMVIYTNNKSVIVK